MAASLLATSGRSQERPVVPPAGVPPARVPPARVPPAGVPPAGVPPAGVPPARVEVVLLETTVGRFATLSEPACAATGVVVFHATFDGGGDALCSTAGGGVRVRVESGQELVADGRRGVVSRIGRQPGVGATLEIAFTATFVEGGRAVLLTRGDAGRCDLIADGGEAFRAFGEQAFVDRVGAVTFRADLDAKDHPDRERRDASPADRVAAEAKPPPQRMTALGRVAAWDVGLFRDRGVDLNTVGRTGAQLLDIAEGFSANDSGFVAFRAARRVGHWSVLLATYAGEQVIATTDDEIVQFGVPALNELGMVAVSATLHGGGATLLRGRFGQQLPERLLASDAGFAALADEVAIDPAGRIAFVGRNRDGAEVLALAGDPAAPGTIVPLLAAGEVVAGRKLASISLRSTAFARSDRLAVRLRFDEGVEAIALIYLRR